MERHLFRNLSDTAVKLVRLLQSPAGGQEKVCKPTQFLRQSVQQYTMLSDARVAEPAYRTSHAYSALLQGVAELEVLEDKYGKGEQSVAASANRVGLSLPKTYDGDKTTAPAQEEPTPGK